MKTAIFTTSVIFLLSFGNVFAGNDLESPGYNESITARLLKILAPVTPKEASFDEGTATAKGSSENGSLAPSTPETAGFDDSLNTEMSMHDIIRLLAPKSPQQVDFNDTADPSINLRQLRPLVPKETYFEEYK